MVFQIHIRMGMFLPITEDGLTYQGEMQTSFEI